MLSRKSIAMIKVRSVGEGEDFEDAFEQEPPKMRKFRESMSSLNDSAANARPQTARNSMAFIQSRAAEAKELKPEPKTKTTFNAAATASAATDTFKSLLSSNSSIVVIYFAVGVAVYKEVEGWSALDACYFMMITSTTVGYGDIAPSTPAGRLFTIFYALLGTAAIVTALAPFVQAVLNPVRAALDAAVPFASHSPRLRALLGPLLFALVGMAYGVTKLALSPIDAAYFAVSTMTTCGYGDLHLHHSAETKAFAMLYVPLAVTILADAIASLNESSSASDAATGASSSASASASTEKETARVKAAKAATSAAREEHKLAKAAARRRSVSTAPMASAAAAPAAASSSLQPVDVEDSDDSPSSTPWLKAALRRHSTSFEGDMPRLHQMMLSELETDSERSVKGVRSERI